MRKLIFVVSAALTLFWGSSVFAQPALDFAAPTSALPTVGSSNSLSWNGLTTGSLVGSNITVDSVSGVNTPVSAGPFSISGGLLNFTSGGLTSIGPTLVAWGAGGPGSITITGGITALGIAGGTSLLSGQVQNAQWIQPGGQNLAITAFVNSVNSVLAGAFGLPGGPGWSGSLTLFFQTTSAFASAFTSTSVGSGNVHTSPPGVVPELDPGSATSALALMSGCVLMLTGRRKLKVTAGRLAA